MLIVDDDQQTNCTIDIGNGYLRIYNTYVGTDYF